MVLIIGIIAALRGSFPNCKVNLSCLVSRGVSHHGTGTTLVAEVYSCGITDGADMTCVMQGFCALASCSSHLTPAPDVRDFAENYDGTHPKPAAMNSMKSIIPGTMYPTIIISIAVSRSFLPELCFFLKARTENTNVITPAPMRRAWHMLQAEFSAFSRLARAVLTGGLVGEDLAGGEAAVPAGALVSCFESLGKFSFPSKLFDWWTESLCFGSETLSSVCAMLGATMLDPISSSKNNPILRVLFMAILLFADVVN